jgi:hypothetical protein
VPVVGHLPWHDTAEVAVERKPIDDRELPCLPVDDERAAIGRLVQLQRRAACHEAQWQAQNVQLRCRDEVPVPANARLPRAVDLERLLSS